MILIIILLLIILVLMNCREQFTNILHASSNSKFGPNRITEVKNDVNPYNLSSEAQTNLYNKTALNYFREKEVDNKQKYLDNIAQQYKQMLEEENKDVTYFYNDTINQSDITENAYNVINQIDNIDYSNVVTGMDKCNLFCKNGLCMEGGYTGVASCIPKPDRPFDYGTLYKNPEFTYGLQVPYYNKNNQEY